MILGNKMTKVCNTNRDDWDLKIPAILWAYRMTCKRMTGQIPFKLVYFQEAVMLMDYIVPSLYIEASISMSYEGLIEEKLS